jgi:2-amino-4-hydroxy-6-hydroxymethyldihydropteridine diphosphokinase
MTNHVFLLLGSNLGESFTKLSIARDKVVKSIGPIVKESSLYRTSPWGKTDQPEFLNQVLIVDTSFSARKVLSSIMSIEEQMGRIRREKWGSRIIDIDILFYNDEIVTEENLIIPHPGIPFRRFTLEPLQEIAPDFVHPQLQSTISELLQVCQDNGEVVRVNL